MNEFRLRYPSGHLLRFLFPVSCYTLVSLSYYFVTNLCSFGTDHSAIRRAGCFHFQLVSFDSLLKKSPKVEWREEAGAVAPG